jgi:hypothetical protein
VSLSKYFPYKIILEICSKYKEFRIIFKDYNEMFLMEQVGNIRLITIADMRFFLQ